MKNMKNERNEKKSPKKNAGFYIALAICVVAIAAAAWTTYGSVMEYSDLHQEETSEQENSENIEAGKDVKGEKYESSTDTDESNGEPSESSGDDTESSGVEASETVVDTTRVQPIENGKVIKSFSPQNPIYSKTTSDWRTHSGIDIGASEGTPVRAITSGTVKSISKDPMLGNVICINHIGGYTAYYCGISDTPVVNEGNIVSTGDTIGYVSTVPSEMLDESHLHLSVMLENDYIDPETFY